MTIRPKQLARIGEFHLEEAVLDVLCESHPEGYGLGAAEISRRAGIYRRSGVVQMNDAIVTGILNQLHDHGKVNRGGWALSDSEYDRRREDIRFVN